MGGNSASCGGEPEVDGVGRRPPSRAVIIIPSGNKPLFPVPRRTLVDVTAPGLRLLPIKCHRESAITAQCRPFADLRARGCIVLEPGLLER